MENIDPSLVLHMAIVNSIHNILSLVISIDLTDASHFVVMTVIEHLLDFKLYICLFKISVNLVSTFILRYGNINIDKKKVFERC